jgi:hypothetical protein
VNAESRVCARLTGRLGFFGIEACVVALAPFSSIAEPEVVSLDLEYVDFVSPAGMALVHCALARLKNGGFVADGSTVTFPGDENVARYLRRMDVFDGLVDFAEPEEFERRNAAGFIPLEVFADEDEADWSAVRVIDSFGLSDRAVTLRLQSNLCEITENAVYHSGAGRGVVVAQRWASKNMVELAIADYGIGIAESIRKNPRNVSLDDANAVARAVELGMTGVDTNRRGQGLWKVSQVVERNGGRMFIRTGAVRFDQDGAHRTVSVQPCTQPGTLVALRLALGSSLDINDILQKMPQDDMGFISFGD